jgi:acetylornithine/succinyldiaminopimelate/putrescine aminotransferase/predicted amino acid dehydrogenase
MLRERREERSVSWKQQPPASEVAPGGVTVTLLCAASELPREWPALVGERQVALLPGFLAAFEAARVGGVSTRYLVAARGGRVEAGAALHRVEIQLEEQRFSWSADLVRKARDLRRPDLLRFRALFCGLNASQGRDDVASGARPPAAEVVAAIAAAAEEIALQRDLDGVIFGHLHEDRLAPFASLRERGYVLLPSLPYATLPVSWRSLEEYLALLRASYRRQALACLQRAERAELVVSPALDLGAHAEEFLPLYLAVVGRAEQKIEVLNAEFFRRLSAAFPGRSTLVGLRRGGRLVAGAAVLHHGARLVCLDVGLDYGLREDADLYHRLMLALVDRAGALGVAHLDLGQTAIAAKARLGARLLRTWLLVKARSPLTAAALRVDRADLRAEPLPERHALREGRDGLELAEPAAAGCDPVQIAGGDYARHVNPDLAALLGVFRLDRVYVRGEGTRLWDSEGREVLDLTSGYGALPFGHNPGWVWDAALALRARGAPQMVQGALSAEAGRLARELCRRAPAPIRYAVFASSGAEAVEVAIKAARAATRRPLIVVAAGGFHGKTLGALSATSDAALQRPFFAPAPGFATVPYGDADALERLLAERGSEVAAFLVEPILGEGGIVVPPDGYLRAARAACDRHGALLLLDEVQTGLGRAGRLFACEEEGVAPDAIALSKALGGGLVPAAACLLAPSAWSEDLALRHSSTFAGNALAATIGLAVLQRLTADDGALLADVRRKGDALRARLRELALRCPALAEVRGRGLMVGLELGGLEEVDSPILRHLAREQKLIPLLCGYLLCRHGVRLMPPLGRKTTLRLIAPLDVREAELARAAEAVEDGFERLQRGDVRALSRYLLDGRADVMSPFAAASPRRADGSVPWRPTPSAERPTGRFVFLLHPLDLDIYRLLEPSLAVIDDQEAGGFDRTLRDLVDAVELSHVRLRSAAGALAEGWFIGVPFTTRGLISLRPHESLRWLRAGLELAKRKGADIVGLGAFTSVVTGGGIGVQDEGIAVTTGNAYTIAVANQALLLAAAEMGVDERRATCAVIGANGTIGRVCSLFLSRAVRRLLLVGNPAKPDAPERLRELAAEVRAFSAAPPEIECTLDARGAVSEAELLVSTTSAVGPILQPEWLRRGAVVCDVAKPSDVSGEVRRLRDDVLVIDGGVVHLPEPVSLGWNFGFEPGYAYACMAETITLAFEGHRSHYSLGRRLPPEQVVEIAARAERHGFRVAGLLSFGRPVGSAELDRVRASAGRTRRVGGRA